MKLKIMINYLFYLVIKNKILIFQIVNNNNLIIMIKKIKKIKL